MQTTFCWRRRQPRFLPRITSAAIAGVICAATLFAVPTAPAPIPPPPSTPAEVFQERINTIESDLANLLQRRTDAAGPGLAIIDYQIDLRIVQRWMLTCATGAAANGAAAADQGPTTKPQDDADPSKRSPTTKAAAPDDDSVAACVALREITLQSAGDQVAQKLQNYAKSMTTTQLHGLKALHDLTYAMPVGGDVGAIDDCCQKIATALILISNPDPIEIKSLPPMRPRPAPARTLAPTTEPAIARPPTIAELTQRVKLLDVSPSLKKQLASLAAAAQGAATDATGDGNPITLSKMLAACTDLAEGLSHNTGIDAAARPKLELQLIESLALFTDVRTRPAGESRIASLEQYRQFLLQLQRIHLPPAVQPRLAPTFAWANANPEPGAKVLATLEKYLQLCALYDARKLVALPFAQKTAVDSLQRQFTLQRTKFLDDAAALASVPTLTSTTPAPTPASLAARVDSMRQFLDNIGIIEPSAHAVAVLSAYRPRPTGGLEKRVVTVVNDLSSAVLVPSREVDIKFLADLEHLAQLAESIAAPTGLSPDIVKNYAHSRLVTVESHRTALIASLASQLAAGKDMDISDLLKLDTLRQMYDALRTAGDVEIGLTKSASLDRWVDWSVSPEQLKALISPYRDATAAAFDGLADDNFTPISRWPAIQKRFAPLLLLVKELGQYADQCKAFPTGLPGDFAKLLTPMNKAPFAVERYASLAIGVWQRASEGTDTKVADGLFDAMLAHLRNDLKAPGE